VTGVCDALRQDDGLIPGAVWWAAVRSGGHHDSTTRYLITDQINPGEAPRLLIEDRSCPGWILDAGIASGIIPRRHYDAVARRRDLRADSYRTLTAWPDIAGVVASNPACPDDILEELAGRAAEENYRVARALLANPQCPTHYLASHARGINAYLVAGNPNTPSHVLLQAWQELRGNLYTGDGAMRRAVARNPASQPEWLDALHTHGDLHELIAANPTTPRRILEAYAQSGPNRVREALLTNSNCPTSFYHTFARDDSGLAAVAAAQPHCPGAVLTQLAEQASGRAWEEVACNPACPTSLFAAYTRGPLLGCLAAYNNPACPYPLLVAAPVGELMLCDSIGGRLPALHPDAVDIVFSMARTWIGDLTSLLETAGLIST